MYHNGEGVDRNLVRAMEYYKASAKGNDPQAQYTLGLMHFNGIGGPRDFKKARDYFERAAATPHALVEAQFNLGCLYANGKGVKKDCGEAARLFRKAAEQGFESSKEALLLVEQELQKQRQAAPNSQLSTSNTCANCGVAEAAGGGALKPCSRCKAVVYCGKECQMQHWKKADSKAGGHREVCKL